MERIKHNSTVKPDYAYNMEKMEMLDEMLNMNNHIAMDVHPNTNVLLDDDGRLHIVDFNLMPSWTRPYIDRYEERCVQLHPFKNIYGGQNVFQWIIPPSLDLHLRGTENPKVKATLEEN